MVMGKKLLCSLLPFLYLQCADDTYFLFWRDLVPQKKRAHSIMGCSENSELIKT